MARVGVFELAEILCVLALACRSGYGVKATPISGELDLNTALGRLRALTASFNIWRLLAGYASQAPAMPVASGCISRSPDGLRTYCVLQGTST